MENKFDKPEEDIEKLKRWSDEDPDEWDHVKGSFGLRDEKGMLISFDDERCKFKKRPEKKNKTKEITYA
jgi:hypothetical protein